MEKTRGILLFFVAMEFIHFNTLSRKGGDTWHNTQGATTHRSMSKSLLKNFPLF